jgi:hypothetical protein
MFLIVGIGLVILVFIAIGSGLANAISKQGYPQFFTGTLRMKCFRTSRSPTSSGLYVLKSQSSNETHLRILF